jgi:hypothetical protein
MKIEAVCPDCGYVMDAASATGDPENHSPEEGDLGICMRCAYVSVYALNEGGQTLGLRRPTFDERSVIEQDADLQALQKRLREADLMGFFAR